MNQRKNTSINKKYVIELDDKKKQYIEFLKDQDLKEETFNNYKNQMYKIRDIELMMSSDRTIERFTADEIIILLKMMQVSSRGSAIAYRDRVLDYLKFCIVEFKINFQLYTLDVITQNNFIDSLVNKFKNYYKYVTEGTLYKELEKLVNPQDKTIIALIYEGIKGKDNVDLLNLKKTNYNKLNKTLTYIENVTNEVKVLKCSDFLASSIEETILADIYYYKNGSAKGKNTEGELTKTEYLLEPNPQFYLNLKQAIPEGNKLLGRTIKRRGLDILKKYLMINNGHVTVESLYSSGLINRAVKYSLKELDSREMSKHEFVKFIQINSTMGKQSGYRMYPIYHERYDDFKKDIILYN